MSVLSERLARLLRVKRLLALALQSRGQAVSQEEPMEAYARKVLAIAASPAFPDLSYTGDCLRRLVQYGEDWYYEWECRSGGVFTAGEPLTADVYLVGGGGKGGPGGYFMPEGEDVQLYRGGGGGAGYPATVTGLVLNAPCTLSIGAGQEATSLSCGAIARIAAAGGNGGAVNGSPVPPRGVGYAGPYHAYDDSRAFAGEAAPPGNASMGTNGCSRLSLLRGVIPHGSDGGVYAGIGYGAGGGGGISGGTPGCQGVALLRVKMALGGDSLPALMDIAMDSGSLVQYTVEGYEGPGFALNGAGELVLLEEETEE